MTWLQPSIGQVCLPTTQRDPSRSGEGSFRYVDIAGIDRETKSISRADLIPCADAPSRARKEIQHGDVLVSTVRPNLNAVAQVPEELHGAIASTGFAVLRANPKFVDPHYLFYRVQQPEFVQFLSARARGANYPAVSDGVVRGALLPLPPISEQRRIVELLDEADHLRKLRREADAKASRIVPALFLKMFGDPTTNPQHFSEESLEGLVDCLDSRRLPVKESERTERGGAIPYYGANGLVGYIDKPLFDETLVLLAEDGGYWGPGESSAYKISGPSWVNNHAHILRCRSEVDPEFLVWHLRLSDLRPYVTGTTRGKITQASMNRIRIMVPPRKLQRRFGEVVVTLTELFCKETAGKEKIEQVFLILLARAFDGVLTADWRHAHMKELLAEMQQQAMALDLALSSGKRLVEA